jgi:hypothetical protein
MQSNDDEKMEYYTEQEVEIPVAHKGMNRLTAASSFLVVVPLLDSHDGCDLLIRALVH